MLLPAQEFLEFDHLTGSLDLSRGCTIRAIVLYTFVAVTPPAAHTHQSLGGTATLHCFCRKSAATPQSLRPHDLNSPLSSVCWKGRQVVPQASGLETVRCHVGA